MDKLYGTRSNKIEIDQEDSLELAVVKQRFKRISRKHNTKVFGNIL